MDTGHALERYDQDSIFNIHAPGLDLKANRRMRIGPSCVDALGDTGFFLVQFRVSVKRFRFRVSGLLMRRVDGCR